MNLADQEQSGFMPTVFAVRLCEALRLQKEELSAPALDLGTGRGIIARYMVANGARVVIGSDIEPSAIEAARHLCREEHPAIRFVVSDLFAKLEGTFRLIVFNSPIFPSGSLSEVHAVVRPAFDGGTSGRELLFSIIDELPFRLSLGGRFVWTMPAFWALEIEEALNAKDLEMTELSRFSVSCSEYRDVLRDHGIIPEPALRALAEQMDTHARGGSAPEVWIKSGRLDALVAQATSTALGQ